MISNVYRMQHDVDINVRKKKPDASPYGLFVGSSHGLLEPSLWQPGRWHWQTLFQLMFWWSQILWATCFWSLFAVEWVSEWVSECVWVWTRCCSSFLVYCSKYVPGSLTRHTHISRDCTYVYGDTLRHQVKMNSEHYIVPMSQWANAFTSRPTTDSKTSRPLTKPWPSLFIFWKTASWCNWAFIWHTLLFRQHLWGPNTADS